MTRGQFLRDLQNQAESIRREAQWRFERFLYLGTVGVWLTSLILYATVVQLVPPLQLKALLWLACMSAVTVLTVLVWSLYGQYLQKLDSRDRWQEVMAISHGSVWAAAPVLFFNAQEPSISTFLLCMAAGLASAGTPIFGTRPRLYWLVFLPMFLSQVLVFSWHGWMHGDVFHRWLGAAILLLLVMNLAFVRLTYETLLETIKLGYENQDLVVQLREQTLAAEQANAAKTKFLAAASHDLRQPVHALNLFVEVLSATELDERQRRVLGHIAAASHASREMLSTLLDFSRIEAGVLEAQPQDTPLAPLLLSLQEEFGLQADAKNLVYRSRDTQAVAHCDPALLALVLRNFVSNAIRYTERGGVLVGVRRRGSEWVVQVWDTGLGIAPEQQEAVFEEFHQLGNPERDRQKGLGLGLAIAKGLAQTMGARISLASRLGRGSCFSLWLPQAAQQPPSSAKTIQAYRSGAWQVTELAQARLSWDNAHAPAPGAQLPGAQLHDLRVLVVDDEAAVRVSMSELLGLWGCEVSVAEDVQTALEVLKQGFTPQVLLTDFRLREGETGADVIAALRDQLGAELPAIIVTGDTAPERLREASSVDAMLMHKPVDAKALQRTLSSVLSLKNH